MRNQRAIEVIVGIFMLMGIAAILFLALKVSGLTGIMENNGYTVHANFTNIGDLKTRAPVTVAGVRVGYVKSIYLDPNTFQAHVQFFINEDVDELSADTSASILTEGLLGSNYISLNPGYDKKRLKDGATISSTHSALILENLIGQLIYKVSGDK